MIRANLHSLMSYIRWCLRISSSSYVVYGLKERVPGIVPIDGSAGTAL